MGTKERRQREVAEREQLFLDKARDLIVQDGLLNLQMSRLAESCDYAIGTLYQHFTSKEDLLVAIACEKAAVRAEMYGRAACWQASSRERIFGVAVADMIFARRYPDYFRLAQYVFTEVVWRAASSGRRNQALEAGKPISAAVFRIYQEAIEAGDLNTRGFTIPELAVGPWTLCLGMHTLVHAEGMLQQYDVHDPYRLLMCNVHHLLNAYGWLPLFDPAHGKALDALIKRIGEELFGDTCRGGE